MSSLRRVQSSKADGASLKALPPPRESSAPRKTPSRHGLFATCLVLDDESRAHFLTLRQQHVDRFRPADEVEFGMIEEMTAACWRQRRAWSIETRMLTTQMARSKDGDALDRMVDAVDIIAAAPSLFLLQRYETRQHLMYQRALRTFIMLRRVKVPNDPSPISEHLPDAMPKVSAGAVQPKQAADSEPQPVGKASRPVAYSQAAAPGKPHWGAVDGNHNPSARVAGLSGAPANMVEAWPAGNPHSG
jgi:hypothetical protein